MQNMLIPPPILNKAFSTLLQGAIIRVLSKVPGADDAIDLLKENFTFSAAEVANNFQKKLRLCISSNQ